MNSAKEAEKVVQELHLSKWPHDDSYDINVRFARKEFTKDPSEQNYHTSDEEDLQDVQDHGMAESGGEAHTEAEHWDAPAPEIAHDFNWNADGDVDEEVF